MNQTLTEEIPKAALLGVERLPLALPTGGESLETAVAGLDASDPVMTLLGAAAMNSLYRQAGHRPFHAPDLAIAPCELDDLPRCSARAEYYLSLILNGDYKDLIVEWLDAVAATGRRVSERYLPELLEAGRTRTELRTYIAPVLGKRGHWLAALNPEWNYAQLSLDFFDTVDAANVAQIDETWHSAGRSARAAVIAKLRGQDPERARTLVESTWSQDSAEERAAFIAAMVTGRTLTDEVFLEKALDDRGKDVRRAAADLLAMLPRSALSLRMIERAESTIKIKRNLIGQASLEVRPPELWDNGMGRDGITEKSPFSYLGQKAWWLTQIIAAVPLDRWTTEWKKTPEQCILLAGANEWAESFYLGWGKATYHGGDAEWVKALLNYWADRKDRIQRQEAYLPNIALLAMRGEAVVIEALKKRPEPILDEHLAFVLLQQWQTPWSATLARLVIDSVKRRVRTPMAPTSTIWQLREALPQFARLAPPEISKELTSDWPEREVMIRNNAWINPVHKFCTTLQIRHDMLSDIRHMKETDEHG